MPLFLDWFNAHNASRYMPTPKKEVRFIPDPDLQPIEKSQLCANGIMGTTDGEKLEVNIACFTSVKLLRQQPDSTSKKVTFFLIYYNDHHHLAQQVDSWTKFSKESTTQIQYIIIDDGSTVGHRAVDFLDANKNKTKPLDILVYEIDQDLPWNIGGARNLGFWVANTPWIFMTDGDIKVDPKTMDFITSLAQEATKKNDTSSVYGFFQRIGKYEEMRKKSPHPAVMLIHKDSYWKAGGCDEDFVGHYGFTDPHFFYRVRNTKSLKKVMIHHMMDSKSIPPLVQMRDDVACPIDTNCLSAYVGAKPSKSSTQNAILFNSRKSKGNWSTEYLRFTWRRAW
jgi:hypothetical protein